MTLAMGLHVSLHVSNPLSLCAVVCACILGLLEPEYEGTTLLHNIDVTQLTRHHIPRHFNFNFLNN
jgi:hypothetical protein